MNSAPRGRVVAATRRHPRLTWRKRLPPEKALVVLAGCGIATAALSGWLAHRADSHRADDLWLEVTKGAIQVIAIGVIGGALSYAWKGLASQRDAQKRRRDRLEAELDDLASIYNAVKTIRRVLRSLGLDDGSGHFTEAQVEGFRAQMKALNDLQLDVETKMHHFGQARLMDEGCELVVDDLHIIEQHLRRVLKAAWEKLGPQVRVGAEVAPVSQALEPLLSHHQFRTNVSDPRNSITSTICADVFGEATDPAKKALVRSVRAQESPEGSANRDLSRP